MKKGFTLIELLAVLVILAIIALIAVPIVLGIIENSRNEANERSIEMYAKAVKNGLATYQLHNDDEVAVGTYSSKTLPFKVSYDGDVECDTIKIRENKKLTLSNCKVNGEDVNYIYGQLTLGDQIVSSNGGYAKANSVSTFNKNLKTGLYKIEDDLGDSYYLRGDIKNNYVKLSGKQVIHHDEVYHEAIKEEAYEPIDIISIDVPSICEEDQECLDYYEIMLEIYPKMKFESKEYCEEFGGYEGTWTTCQVSNIKDVYHVDLDEGIYFKTEKDCVDSYNAFGAEITSCEKYTLRNEPAYTEEAYDEEVYKDTYYRIVRINGDGTIRLIYDGEELVENGEEHTATTTDSLDTWYQKNIVNYSLDKYIANTVYYEKSIYNGYDEDPGASISYSYTYKTSDLKQDSQEQQRVGLLSATEAAIAGALGPIANNYLSGSAFRTVNLSSIFTNYYGTCENCWNNCGASDSPCWTCQTYTCTTTTNYYYAVDKNGKLTALENGATRPVINLIEDVPFTGTGTITDPYVIKSY